MKVIQVFVLLSPAAMLFIGAFFQFNLDIAEIYLLMFAAVLGVILSVTPLLVYMFKKN